MIDSLVYVVSLLLLAFSLYRLAKRTGDAIGITLVLVSMGPLVISLGALKAFLVWLALISLAGCTVVLARGLATGGR